MNDNSNIIGVTDEGYPIVSDTYCCDFWEAQAVESLCPIKECWYCKYADFRKSTATIMRTSICRNPQNRVPVESGCKNENLSKGDDL